MQKSETRNSKSETNSKSKCRKRNIVVFRSFGLLAFEFVSDFGFGVSDLLLLVRHLDDLDLAHCDDAARVVLLDGEMPLVMTVLLVPEIDGGLAVHLDDDVIADGNDFLGEPHVGL